jgi:hypothetical protein
MSVPLTPQQRTALVQLDERLAAAQAAQATQRAQLAVADAELAAAEGARAAFLQAVNREWSPERAQPMFTRISGSNESVQIDAFCGGGKPHTVLSICKSGLLPFFSARTALPLRAVAKEMRSVIAHEPWESADTPILGSVRAWAACFPAARSANLGARAREGAPPVTPEDWAALRGLRELHLLGASGELLEAARSALPGVRVLGALAGACEARHTFEAPQDSHQGLAALEGGLLVSGKSSGTTLQFWRLPAAGTGNEGAPAALEPAGSIEGVSAGAIAALPGQRLVACSGYGGRDPAVSLWCFARRARVWLKGHAGRGVISVVSIPGGRVATGGEDGTARVWDAATGALLAIFNVKALCCRVAALTDGRLAISNGRNVDLYHVPTSALSPDAAPLLPSRVLADAASSTVLAFTALEGNRLALACMNSRVLVWNAGSGALEATLGTPGSGPFSLAALPGGLLAIGCKDGVHVWSTAARARVALLPCVANAHMMALVALPGGRIASTTNGGEISVWSLHFS